ncbi:M48 family metalloprotease [Labrys neptuniae]
MNRKVITFFQRLKIIALLLVGLVGGGVILAASIGLVLVAIVLLRFSAPAGVLVFKLLLVLLVPAYALLVMVYRLFSAREPEVVGRELKPEEAPALFAALAEVRAKMRGPRIDKVVLDDTMNAFALSRPGGGFWFVPWRRRYVGLGIPLLQSLSPAEAMAVVAHEYGHIAGLPSRFDAFVYRLHHHLFGMLAQIGGWSGWVSHWFGRLVRGYILRFGRLSYGLRREAEFAADRASADLVGARQAGQALIRLRLASAYLAGPVLHDAVAERSRLQPEPDLRPFADMPRLMNAARDADFNTDALRRALYEETADYDSHPALAERLQALGLDPEALLREAGELTPVAEASAASIWFGEGFESLVAPLDKTWQDNVRPHWERLHAEARQRETRSQALAGRQEEAKQAGRAVDADTEWEMLELAGADQGAGGPHIAALKAFMLANPDHAASRLAWGQAMAGSKDPAVPSALRAAALLDPTLAREAALALSRHFSLVGGDDGRLKAHRYSLMALHYGQAQ